MSKKKAIFGVLLAVIAVALFMVGAKVFGDEAGDPYSSQPGSNIGAWYDEIWQASGLYYLTDSAATSWQYEYASYSDLLNLPATATLPSSSATDLVVTEWSVTGHVHFRSGL